MTTVFVAIYEHRHGTDVGVFATEAGAQTWKDELTREYWSEYCEGEPRQRGQVMPTSMLPGKYSDGEFFSLEKCLIQET